MERDPREVHDRWTALAASRAEPSIFLTPEWTALVRRHDPNLPITLAVGDPPEAIVRLSQDSAGTLRYPGGELTDLQDVLAAPGSEAASATAFAHWLADSGAPRIDLANTFEDSPTFPILREVLGDSGYAVEQERLVTSPWLTLPDDFEVYVASLGKKERHELRRKMRKLEATATARYRYADDDERGRVLDRFVELHRRSRGIKAEFMTAGVEAFFRDAAERMAALGWLRLGVLEVNGDDAAILFGFAYGNVLALYNSAYDPAFAPLSIGIVSHAWAIRDAIAQGFQRYDLLRGDEPYKYDLGAQDRFLARLVATKT